MSKPTKEELAAQRARYMSDEITHQNYYCWLSDAIGLRDSLIPFSADQVRNSKDQHLNDLPLAGWDRMDPTIRSYAAGLPWSLSDTVCCLKAMARRRAEREKGGEAQ